MKSMAMEEIILKSDPRAAEKVTVEMWKSRWGFLYKDEDLARYDGCTHSHICECGSGLPVEKSYTVCSRCRRRNADDRYLKLSVGELEFPCALFEDDVYFHDVDDIEFYCEEHDALPQDLRLVNCEDVYLTKFDPDSYWGGEYPEDRYSGDLLSEELLEKIKELNEIIKNHPSICYRPGKIRATYDLK